MQLLSTYISPPWILVELHDMSVINHNHQLWVYTLATNRIIQIILPTYVPRLVGFQWYYNSHSYNYVLCLVPLIVLQLARDLPMYLHIRLRHVLGSLIITLTVLRGNNVVYSEKMYLYTNNYGVNPPLELFGLAMSPRSANHRPKHAWMACEMSPYHWGEFQSYTFHIVPSMGSLSQLWIYRVGKTHSRKADQSTKPGNGTVYV